MSSYSDIYSAVVTLIDSITGLTPSGMPLDFESLSDATAPGPVGGLFLVRPLALAYGGDQGSNVDGGASFEVMFTWAHTPDPATRMGEALTRAETIRNKLLDDANLSVDCRFDVGDATFIYSADLIGCTIPFTALSYRST